MTQKLIFCFITFVLALCTTQVVLALTITTFDPPGSFLTEVVGINEASTIAGIFEDSSAEHGFVRRNNGTITTFDAPRSIGTLVIGINDAGTIAGGFTDSGGSDHGFIVTPCESFCL